MSAMNNKPELVERVAQTCANDRGARVIAGKADTVEFDDMDVETQDFWRCIAAAAIEELGVERLVAALERIRDLKPRPYDKHPTDWREQIDACEECQRYSGHPIQQGICNTHRRPLWERETHDKHEERALGSRAAIIAREALSFLSQNTSGALND
jgi:hypothetical protein